MLPASPVPQSINTAQHLCLHHLLADWAMRTPDVLAILAPGRDPLTYGHLYRHIDNMVRVLHGIGVDRHDRIALVLPNGPEMALAFLTISAVATCIPLNPAYRADEFDFYLTNLPVKALIIQADMDSPARDVATRHAIPLIELVPVLEAEAGRFLLTGDMGAHTTPPNFAQPDDVALGLYTSGTTARPKLVPLTHINLCTSVRNHIKILALSTHDRCLNVMPLFHAHGLVSVILASMLAGASVVCLPDFSPPQFFRWMDAFHPTWYTAAPSIHQAILAHAAPNSKIIARCPLRFIRSAAAPLLPQTMEELEDIFDVPVIQAYGTTEAAAHISSNPLPPHIRKAGSVGVAIGPEVAIMDEGGHLLPASEIGEVVVRGATVMHGYDNDPMANRSAFTHGWFRTGDQGYVDTDGYLFITGRLKEIINRGGEKIAPYEIEEALMEHPAVAEVAAFAMPCAELGEDVAVAIVLRKNASVTSRQIREFAGARLAHFKIPRQVVFVDAIPKGATGKVQRNGLAVQLSLSAPNQARPKPEETLVAPLGALELQLTKMWEQILGITPIGVRDNFFELGGHSLHAARLFVHIEKAFGKNLPLAILFQAPTVEQLACVLRQEVRAAPWSCLVAIQPGGSKPPFFCIHTPGGEVLSYYDLARHLGADQPVYGLRALGLDGNTAPLTRIEDMAAHYVKEVRSLQPDGPYFLGGFCFGGILALEMAQQLHAHGQKVALLALFDAYHKEHAQSRTYTTSLLYKSAQLARKIRFHFRELLLLDTKEKLDYLKSRVLYTNMMIKKKLWESLYNYFLRKGHPVPLALQNIQFIHEKALADYAPQPYAGHITLFASEVLARWLHNPTLGWSNLAHGGLDVQRLPCNHENMFREPHVRVIAAHLSASILQAMARNCI